MDFPEEFIYLKAHSANYLISSPLGRGSYTGAYEM